MEQTKKENKFLVRFLLVIIVILLVTLGTCVGWYLGKEGKISITNNNVEQSEDNGSNQEVIENSNNNESEIKKLFNTINKDNFKKVEIGLLNENYNYTKKEFTDYKTAQEIISIVSNFKFEETNTKSLPEMNYITINFGASNVTVHYNSNNNDVIITTGEGENYKSWSGSNNVTELKKLVNSYNITTTETNKTTKQTTNTTINVVKELSTSGWAGSSLQKVRLYSNGEVYHIVYSGEGTTDEYLVKKELIAQNAEDIQEQTNGQAVEKIIVKGKNLKTINTEITWIEFEK